MFVAMAKKQKSSWRVNYCMKYCCCRFQIVLDVAILCFLVVVLCFVLLFLGMMFFKLVAWYETELERKDIPFPSQGKVIMFEGSFNIIFH